VTLTLFPASYAKVKVSCQGKMSVQELEWKRADTTDCITFTASELLKIYVVEILQMRCPSWRSSERVGIKWLSLFIQQLNLKIIVLTTNQSIGFVSADNFIY